MSGEIANAFVKIRPNMSGFQAETESGVKGAFKEVAKLAAEAFAAEKAFDFGKEIISSAAKVQKSTEAIRDGFGKAADSVLDFTDKAAAKLGISAAAGEATAAKFSMLFKNMGIGQQQAATMTVGFEKLAGSLAAIKGVDPSDAMNALAAASAGSTRGLKQLGIVIDSNQIKQEALRLGLLKTASATGASRIADEQVAIAKANLANAEKKYGDNTTQVASAQIALQKAQAKVNSESTKIVGALTPAAKAQAVYSLATKNLGSLQEQAGKHSGDLIDVQKRLSAEWSNMKDELGAKLLPFVAKLAGVLADDLPKAFELAHTAGEIASDFFRDHVAGPFDQVRSSVVLLGQELTDRLVGPFEDVRERAESVGDRLRDLVPSMDTVKETAAKIADAMQAAIKFTVQYQNVLLPLGGALGSITLAMEAWTVATEVWTAVTTIATAVQEAFNLSMDANPIGIIILAIIGLVGALVVLYQRSKTVHDAVNALFNGMREVAVATWQAIEPVVITTMKVIRDVLVGGWQAIKIYVVAVWDTIRIVVGTVLNVIRDLVNLFLDVVSGNWGKVWGDVKQIFADVLHGMTALFGVWWHAFVSVINTFGKTIENVFGDVWGAVSKTFTKAETWLTVKADEIVLKVIEPFTHLPKWLGGGWAQDMKKSVTDSLDALKNPAADHLSVALNSLKDPAAQAGTNVAAAFAGTLVSGINDAMTAAVTAAQSGLPAAGNSVNAEAAAKGAHGIASTAATTSQSQMGGAQMTVAQGQQYVLSILKKAGWTPDQLQQAVNLMNYEDGSGAPGDNNSSFGPRQLHVGGQLPSWVAKKGAAFAQQWAWSPAGLAYAAQGIAGFGNLTGAALAQAIANKQGSSDIPKEAAAIYGGVIPAGGGDGNGTSGTGLHVGTSLTGKTPAQVAADRIASAKTSLSASYASIVQMVQKSGEDLNVKVAAQMKSVRAEISNVASQADAAKAKVDLRALHTTVSAELAAIKQDVALNKTYDALKKATAELGTSVSPEVQRQMRKIQAALATATTPQQIAALRKQMTDVKETITTQLAETNRKVTLEGGLATLRKQAAQLHEDITPAIQAGMLQIQDAIATVTTAASASRVKQQMADLKTTIANELARVKKQIEESKASFTGAWTQLSSGIDAAFDRSTQRALKNMQVQVSGAFASFTFGGAITQTPAEVALQQLQDTKNAADAAAQYTADKLKLATDLAADSTATADQIAQDRAAVANDEYNAQVAALQATAAVERAAANQQLQDAQQAYQDQRDLLKQQLDARVAAIETGMLDGTIAASTGMAQLSAVLGDPQYGIDVRNSGLILGTSLYKGLADGLQPTFDLLNSLIDLMKKAGLNIDGTAAGGGNAADVASASAAALLAAQRSGATQAQAALNARSAGLNALYGIGASKPSKDETVETQQQILEELKKQTGIAKEGTAVQIRVGGMNAMNDLAAEVKR